MEQRPLRLGDILDDYCPRERRVTNHAIVAMIGEGVQQTRCTTCDSEHAYKGGRPPRRKKKDAPSALYREVLAGMPETEIARADAADPAVPALVPPSPSLRRRLPAYLRSRQRPRATKSRFSTMMTNPGTTTRGMCPPPKRVRSTVA